VDQQDEEAWNDPHGSVSLFSFILSQVAFMTTSITRMAYGLGMNAEEWDELRAQVDDSFWVMRIIGWFSTIS
jgi:hypothetical membrane protein